METININIPYTSISGTTKETRYQLQVTCSGIDYYPIEELSTRSTISTRQLERYIKQINEKEMWRYLLYIEGKRFISPALLFLNRKYRKQLKNKEYSKWLSAYTWDYALCFGFDEELGKNGVRNLITGYWDKLQRQYPKDKVILFFTTEKYEGSKGYHLHAILGVSGKNKTERPIRLAQQHFNESYGSNLWYQQYDHQKCYTDYIVKYLHHDKDGHDLFYHNI